MNPIDILFIGEYPLLYVETRRIRLVFMFMVYSTLPRLNIYLETRRRCESPLIILQRLSRRISGMIIMIELRKTGF